MKDSLFDLHNALTGENLKEKARKRRTVKEVEEDYSLKITELRKEIILLKNLLRFYINDDWE